MFGINKDLNIHFIGIGGIGMSGIAHVLIKLGYKISGSDISESQTVKDLEAAGAKIFLGHNESNIKDVQLIVYSSAIDNTNPEVKKAVDLKIPIVKRAEMLAELMRLKYGIAVAGSHGKTTTTSMLSTIFKQNELNPTCIVGGVVKNLAGQSISGNSKFLIAEADESDGSFLFLNPIMSIITNIDNDHLDFYKSEENIFKAFVEFSNKVPFYGCVAINTEDKNSERLLTEIKRPYITYGFDNKADYSASDIELMDGGCRFLLKHEDFSREVNLKMLGDYNILNALAAVSISHQAGISLENCCSGVEAFEGVGRRFEYLMEESHFCVIDDYAHHPTEIHHILSTFNKKYHDRKKVCFFQPHRFSRTKEHWSEFVEVLSQVDEVNILPIYAASEIPVEYIDSEILVKNINEKSKNANYVDGFESAKNIIMGLRKEGPCAILTLGAGSISKEMRSIVASL
ncbi:MAG: UDP-N-acetylmuramate--L-alanine ligase [Halobacteriovoraceae bacterium]|nr:UDP-N-acetylmuramate--L-alanine ligase [Halobacteriovoraceae bacterium]|tara:strand:+ start:11512 stop:12882 length:1371 start_codon:yes stop_codon:yes gene_type:complete